MEGEARRGENKWWKLATMLGVRRYQEDAFFNGLVIVDLPLSLSLFLVYCMYANLNGCEWDSIEPGK